MKKYTLFGVCCLVLLFSAVSIHAQEGFTGPRLDPAFRTVGDGGSYYQPAAVSQLSGLPRNARVVLTGNLVNEVRGGRYFTFRDSTGEIVVEIEREYWGGLTAGPNDRVQIYGKVERNRDGRMQFDVSIIRKQ